MAVLETRTISGKGLLRLNTGSEDYKKAKIITLYVDVIREPINKFENYNYNPPESRYATLRFMRSGYVVRTEVVSVKKSLWDFYPEPSAQTMYAVQCAYEGILETFFNLGNALGLPSISITDNIKDWNHTDLFWDEIKVVCYADSAVQLRAVSKPYDLCPEQQDKEPDPPPPPPEDPPPPSVPPGTPLDETNEPVSDPYEGDDDGGDTVPYPLDVPPEPPPGGDIYRVAVDLVSSGVVLDTAYTQPFESDGEPTIVSVTPGGSGYLVVVVNIPGIGNTLIGATSYKSDCTNGFGSTSGNLDASTARVESTSCPLIE